MCYSWISEIGKREIGINRNRNSKNWSTGKHEIEKETFGPQLYVIRKCSMWAPCITRYTSILYLIFSHTRCSIASSISTMAFLMRTRRSSMVGCKGGRYTCCFTKPQRKNHKVWGRGNVEAKASIQNLHVQHVQPISLEIVYSDHFRHLSGNGVVPHPAEKWDLLCPVSVVEEAITVTSRYELPVTVAWN